MKLSKKLRIFSGLMEPYSDLENRVLSFADEAKKLEKQVKIQRRSNEIPKRLDACN
jgi:hypothetical protein